MKHYFIKQTNNHTLDLIFAGWGMDATPFLSENTPNDLCICYDYTDLELDVSLFKSYRHIRLLAWSMGVWAAASVFQNQSLIFQRKIAINGTMEPVNDDKGIPHSIFKGTLDHLSPLTLEKFNRRMCGSQERKHYFEEHAPKRNIESLRSELASIYTGSLNRQPPCFKWDMVIIGNRDLIFPAENQRKAWSGENIIETNDAHYPQTFLDYARTNR
ncbi:MAG: DUF452 family protein [Bacteroidales bacterium]